MRTEGWEQRLYALTVAAMARPHEWGQNDCVTFAADVVRELTGDITLTKQEIDETQARPLHPCACAVDRPPPHAPISDLLVARTHQHQHR